MPENSTNTKWAGQSLTVLGILVAAIPQLLASLGVALPEGLVGDTESVLSRLIELLDGLHVWVGTVMALWGRYRIGDLNLIGGQKNA